MDNNEEILPLHLPNEDLSLMHDDEERLSPRVRTEIKLVLTIFISLLLALSLTVHLN